jgi:hypothetical protein
MWGNHFPEVLVRRTLLVVLASSTLLFDSAGSQAPSITWPPLAVLSASSLYTRRFPTPLDNHLRTDERSDTVARQIRRSYWKEGGLVAGVASSILVGLFAQGMCAYAEGNTRNCGLSLITGALLGGGVGFGLGALVGGQFPKRPPRMSSDSADIR